MTLDDTVTEGEAGYDFACPVPGDQGRPCFRSPGWPTREIALARALEHIEEHVEAENAAAEGREIDRSKLTSELKDFRAKHGVSVTDDGRAVLTGKDLLP